MAKSPKNNLFISHAAVDAQAARLLQHWLNEHLKSHVEIHIFCSSHVMSPGTPWYRQITNELMQCKIGILLATPNSIHRPWVLFEAGALAGHGKIHIPVCAGGFKKSDLVSPLGELQAIEFSDLSGPRSLLEAIAKEVGIPAGTIQNFLVKGVLNPPPPDLDALIHKPSPAPAGHPVPAEAESASDSISGLLRELLRSPDRWCSVIYTCRSTFSKEICPGDHQVPPIVTKALKSHISIDEFRTVGLVQYVHVTNQEEDVLANGLICSKHARDLISLDGPTSNTDQTAPDILDRDWLIIGENNISDVLLRIMQAYLPWVYRVNYVHSALQPKTRTQAQVEIEYVSRPLYAESKHPRVRLLRAGSSMLVLFPNPFNINRDVIVLFGCHRSGQYALESALQTATLKKSITLLTKRLQASCPGHLAAQIIVEGVPKGTEMYNPTLYQTRVVDNNAETSDPFWLVPLSKHGGQSRFDGDSRCENPTPIFDVSLLVLFDQSEQEQIGKAVGDALDDLDLYWENVQGEIGFHVTLFEFLLYRDPDEQLVERSRSLAETLLVALQGSRLIPEQVVVRVRQLEILSNSLSAYADFLSSEGEPIDWLDSVRRWCEEVVRPFRTTDTEDEFINSATVPFPQHVTLCRFPRALNAAAQKRLQTLTAQSRRMEFARFPIKAVTLVLARKSPYRDTEIVGEIPLRSSD